MYYVVYGSRYYTGYSIAKYWLKPAPPSEMLKPTLADNFKYVTLRNGLPMFIEDGIYDCNNASLPCFPLFFQQLRPEWIEARGEKITVGFKMKQEAFK